MAAVIGEVHLPTEVKKAKKTSVATANVVQTYQPEEEGQMQALVAANGVSISSEDEGAAQKHTLRRKRKRRKAAESLESKELADARSSDGEGDEDACESKETVPSSHHKRVAEASDGSSDSSDDEELSEEEEDSGDEDGEKRTDDSTAFGRAFQKIMKKKLPSSVLSEAMGPILSAHKQLVAKKLEEAAEGWKKRSESKREKQALREKGHVVPAPYAAAKDKELIKLATRGVVKLFNAVSKAQSVQEGAKVTGANEAKEVAKRSKSTFLAMLQGGDGSSFKAQKQPLDDKKERVAEHQPSWSALQDTFMLGKSRLKDWDKKQDDGAGLEGTENSGDDSDSE